MSLSANFPTIKPSLLLDFANTEALDPRITFTRTTTATYYNGVTTAKAEENLVIDSGMTTGLSGLSSSSGDLTAVSTFDTRISPNGFLYGDSTGGAITAYKAGAVASTQYTLSCFVVMTDTLAPVFGSANVNNAANSFYLVIGNQSIDPTTYTVTNFGSGLYRVSGTGTSSTTNLTRSGVAKGTANEARTFTVSGYQLEQRSSVTAYTPTTTQPITNYIPVLLTAPAGVARFDHNPTTGESLGLLIEEQRTNLLLRSEEFDNAAWTNERTSEQVDVIVSPAGTLTGDKLVEDTTATNTHNIIQGKTGLASGSTLTFSVYLKAAERTSVRLQINDGSSLANAVLANYDASTGVASSTQSIGTFTGASATITPVGNGWYRCSISGVATGVTAVQARIFLISGGTTTYTGNGYSGIYIWGAQLEEGAFPTSYIPTVAATVTRNADAASMTGTNFSSWYNQAEGTIYAEANRISNAAPTIVWSADDLTANNRQSFVFTAPTTVRYRSITNNVTDVAIDQTIPSSGYFKAAGAYKLNDFACSAQGATAGTDTSALIPVATHFNIGNQLGNSGFLNGTIRKLAYYPIRCTNAQLQALTTV